MALARCLAMRMGPAAASISAERLSDSFCLAVMTPIVTVGIFNTGPSPPVNRIGDQSRSRLTGPFSTSGVRFTYVIHFRYMIEVSLSECDNKFGRQINQIFMQSLIPDSQFVSQEEGGRDQNVQTLGVQELYLLGLLNRALGIMRGNVPTEPARGDRCGAQDSPSVWTTAG